MVYDLLILSRWFYFIFLLLNVLQMRLIVVAVMLLMQMILFNGILANVIVYFLLCYYDEKWLKGSLYSMHLMGYARKALLDYEMIQRILRMCKKSL
jgi:hypothetical protein